MAESVEARIVAVIVIGVRVVVVSGVDSVLCATAAQPPTAFISAASRDLFNVALSEVGARALQGIQGRRCGRTSREQG